MTQKPEFAIQGRVYPRIKYGQEATEWGASTRACSSCGVAAGDFHHAGCFVERCPACGGQAVSCRCAYQESFPRHPMSNVRRNFYKLFYLAFVPSGLMGLVLWSIPWDLPLAAAAGLVLGIPLVAAVLFWTKLGEMELSQVITTRKDHPS
jgi:hypothetical protein